ncbi:helix-turn-helix domain-containing protein [Brevibacillus sp. NPDC058079]|uniref:helix-turn-helix domain-containing protein n=1 Tax=Brevibacillus sp. NPDC058079 TaxID=3346330 RepID=UPI0036EAF6B3
MKSVGIRKSIGDILSRYRSQNNLSLLDLAEKTGISKGVLSRIENGETKRPEYKTVKTLVTELPDLYDEMMECYIEEEHRPELLEDILQELTQFHGDSPLIEKVSLQFLQSPLETTDTLLERLYGFTTATLNPKIKITLYNSIVKYARERGEPRFVAKGLLQKYLFERYDLKRLEETFRMGEKLLDYKELLSQEERVTFYYRMSLHAFGAKRYHECIELGKLGHREDTTINHLQEQVALAICNSYLYLEDYPLLEKHLKLYEDKGYKFVTDRVKFYRAIILSKTGDVREAIPLLRECVEEAVDGNRLHRVNVLLDALFRNNSHDSIGELFKVEDSKVLYDIEDPYYYDELARYYRFKGNFFTQQENYEEGVEAYLSCIQNYAKVNNHTRMLDITPEIFAVFGKIMKHEFLEKAILVYNIVNNSEERSE